MKKFLLSTGSFLLCINVLFAQKYTVQAPDQQTEITVLVTDRVSYSVIHNNATLISPSQIGLELEGKGWSPALKVKKANLRSSDEEVFPIVRQKNKVISDHYNELVVDFKNKLSLVFRAYNNGVAYRWEYHGKGPLKVVNELLRFTFNADDSVYYPQETGFYSHNERLYQKYSVAGIDSQKLASLPALVDHEGTKVLITEADLYDYPGLWLIGNGKNALKGIFPAHPSQEKETSDRDRIVVERDHFLAETMAPRSLPWRVLMIADKDADLISNQLVYLLSRATKEDFSWVKPGKVAWDWWNANNIYNVDFRAGINTDTYKYYIDFAASNGLDYIILDEGWSDIRDLLKVVPTINLDELSAYAKQKNVGIILWMTWLALDKQLDQALDQFVQWGVRGIKVDFMQRDDQLMVNFYERVAKAAAKRKLLVDFHGAYKPTGMERLYPNVISLEGVDGLDQSKWDNTKSIGPDHNLMLPFIRMCAGPMDYTPGAMQNAQKSDWHPVFNNPSSLGTRCHQLAMYVIYESPLQMLADNPTHYMREPECLDFLSKVPTVWDQTLPLDGKTGHYVVVARKAANGDWYIGAMTDWSPREISISLSFLENGNYSMDLWQDGINADRNANDFKKSHETVDRSRSLTVHLAPGGGWVARLVKN